MKNFFLKKNKDEEEKGFSLIEIAVSIGIFMIMTGILLYNHGKFNSNLIVTNLAYEVALAVRSAQVYGLSVLQAGTGTDNFSAAYGISISKEDPITDTKDIIIFADTNPPSGNNFYTQGQDVLEEMVTIQGNNYVSEICVNDTTCSGFDILTITFKRPNPEAIINTFESTGSIRNQNASNAKITLKSSRSDKVSVVTVTNTGQISIHDEYPSNP